jgi:hexosaminidase
MFKKVIFFVAIVLAACTASTQIHIIPQPVSIVMPQTTGSFVIEKQTKIIAKEDDLKNSIGFLNDYLQQFYGFQLRTEKNVKNKRAIYLGIQKVANGIAGGYTLEVNNNGIYIQGNDEAGVFYGIQSLVQLLPLVKSSNLPVPYIQIKDAPRFQYRGMHLDVGRHFFPVSFIKKYIDYIALHKMNYFHWHLTEDQGWRIEIKKYPELTKIGGFRDGTIIGRYPGKGNDHIRYGGYYTQDEIKEIVQYAAQRYITVVPEIEMPGHSSAALTAYPSLGCTGGPYQVQQTWGVFNDVFCAGNDSVFAFLQDVIDEVVTLFLSKYIHIGGDECPKESWKTCAKCQKRMKDNGLKNEHELQSYFIQRMEKYINSKERTIIGWDEILEGGLAPNAVVMSWQGEKGGIEAAKQNHYVIMTPGSHVYLDHSQSKNEDSVTIGGYTTVQKIYSYEPVPKEIPAANEKYVLGAQGNVWTEYMKYPSKVEYQIFPRMSALSEVLWSPKNLRNWEGFEPRLQQQFKRYDFWKVNYSKAYLNGEANVAETK